MLHHHRHVHHCCQVRYPSGNRGGGGMLHHNRHVRHCCQVRYPSGNRGGGGMLHHHRHVRHCCQVSPIGFPADLRKKFCKTQKKFCIQFCKGFRKEIFFNKTKFRTQKIDFLSKLPLKKLKIPLLPLLGYKFGGPLNHQNFSNQRKFCAALLSYLAEFLATWQQ